MAVQNQPKRYTSDEFDALVKDKQGRYELIDGVIYSLSDPEDAGGKIELVDGVPYALAGARLPHQLLVGRLFSQIDAYIRKNKGKCVPAIAPFDVRLEDGLTVQPDVMVICDKNKIDDDLRCYGAPDLVIEVVSSNHKHDYFTKQKLYRKYGVREYWVVDPDRRMTTVFLFEQGNNIRLYDWGDAIPVGIYENAPVQLSINLAELLAEEES